jgi:hypothetical protein
MPYKPGLGQGHNQKKDTHTLKLLVLQFLKPILPIIAVFLEMDLLIEKPITYNRRKSFPSPIFFIGSEKIKSVRRPV